MCGPRRGTSESKSIIQVVFVTPRVSPNKITVQQYEAEAFTLLWVRELGSTTPRWRAPRGLPNNITVRH
eukprot:1161255-Pelagomonas_calceolata.AAC.7